MNKDRAKKAPPQDRPVIDESEDINEFLAVLQERQAMLVARMTQTQQLINSFQNQKKYQDGIDLAGMIKSSQNVTPHQTKIITCTPYTLKSVPEIPLTSNRLHVNTPNATDHTTSISELFSYLSLSNDPLSESKLRRKSSSFKYDVMKDADLSNVVAKLHDILITMTPSSGLKEVSKNIATNIEAHADQTSCNIQNSPKSDSVTGLNHNKVSTEEGHTNQRDLVDIISNSIIRGSIEDEDRDSVFFFLNKIVAKLHEYFNDRNVSYSESKQLLTPSRKWIRRRISEGKHEYSNVLEDTGVMADIDTDYERIITKPDVVSMELLSKWNYNKDDKGQNNESSHRPFENTSFEERSTEDAGEDGDIDSDHIMKTAEKKNRCRVSKEVMKRDI